MVSQVDATGLSSQGRFHALDGLRASMMLLGIFFHAAWFFFPLYLGQPGSDVSGDWGFSYFFYWVHLFRMQAFFVIAGFFACLLIKKRGLLRFTGNRVLRVALPFILFTLILFPLMRYQVAVGGLRSGRIQDADSAWQVLQTEFSTQVWSEVWPVHLWFLETLMLLYVISMAMFLVSEYILDRKKKLRSLMQQLFARVVGSPWGLLLLTLPIAAVLFWEETWYGLDTGPLNPKWLGVFGYWVYFAFGWCLFKQPALLRRFDHGWPWQLAVGSLLSLGLCFYCNSLIKEGKMQWIYPVIVQTEIQDYGAIRDQLLVASQDGTPSVAGRVWDSLSPEYQDFIRRQPHPSGDQLAGITTHMSMTTLTSPGLADPDLCSQLALEPEWKAVLAVPADQRSPGQMMELNRRILEATFAPALAPRWTNATAIKAVYFFLYALTSSLLVCSCIGFFNRFCSQPSPGFRYLSDSSYWLYLAHLPVQYQIQLWVGLVEMNALLKITIYVVVSFAVLIPSYHYLVRSTWLGVLLNGRRFPFTPLLSWNQPAPAERPAGEMPIVPDSEHVMPPGMHSLPPFVVPRGDSQPAIVPGEE